MDAFSRPAQILANSAAVVVSSDFSRALAVFVSFHCCRSLDDCSISSETIVCSATSILGCSVASLLRFSLPLLSPADWTRNEAVVASARPTIRTGTAPWQPIKARLLAWSVVKVTTQATLSERSQATQAPDDSIQETCA
jgi:hypothetical protein